MIFGNLLFIVNSVWSKADMNENILLGLSNSFIGNIYISV
jgi:hypothetical protein